MAFSIVKLISWWLQPTNICIILFGVAVVLLVKRRWARFSRPCLIAGLAILATFSNGIIARWMALPLEGRFNPIVKVDQDPISSVRHISVLGGGHSDDPGLTPNNMLNVNALARLVEAVRLANALPNTKLIVSGTGYGGATDAEIMKLTALGLGLEASRIIQCDTPRNTLEEAEAIKPIVGNHPFILVTSAMHLPRAVAIMHRLGMRPIPAPTNYLTRPIKATDLLGLPWSADSLNATTSAMHEYLGLLWAWMRGKA